MYVLNLNFYNNKEEVKLKPVKLIEDFKKKKEPIVSFKTEEFNK